MEELVEPGGTLKPLTHFICCTSLTKNIEDYISVIFVFKVFFQQKYIHL